MNKLTKKQKEKKKEWICDNCGGKWMEGSMSCPYSHSSMSSMLRPEYQPVKIGKKYYETI